MLTSSPLPHFPEEWELPEGSLEVAKPRSSPYCVVIPVLNEGDRIREQLERMRAAGIPVQVDILLVDGGSIDGALEPGFLETCGVRALIVKKGPGRLGAQLRLAYAYALMEGYEGILTIDGNNKDSVGSIPAFVEALKEGFDYVQGSRYLPGGKAVRTPLVRHWASRCVHAPLLSWASGTRLTDTTNGFRGYSRRYLLDPRVQPFRAVFDHYETLAYLSVRAGRLGLKVREIPVERIYPVGAVPTKIQSWKSHWGILVGLGKVIAGHYDPPAPNKAP